MQSYVNDNGGMHGNTWQGGKAMGQTIANISA